MHNRVELFIHRYLKLFNHSARRILKFVSIFIESNLKKMIEHLKYLSRFFLLFRFGYFFFLFLFFSLEGKLKNVHYFLFQGNFDCKRRSRNMSVAPHNQQCIFASFANIIIHIERIFARMFHLHFFTWPFWIVQAHEQYAVTYKKNTHTHDNTTYVFIMIIFSDFSNLNNSNNNRKAHQ